MGPMRAAAFAFLLLLLPTAWPDTPEAQDDGPTPVDGYLAYFEGDYETALRTVLEHNGDSAWDRIPESATAFDSHSSPYNFVVTSAWSDPKDTDINIAWTRELFSAMGPFAGKGAYVNYLGGDEGADGLKAAYGAKLAHLAELKAR